jgi:hypothetical protein
LVYKAFEGVEKAYNAGGKWKEKIIIIKDKIIKKFY